MAGTTDPTERFARPRAAAGVLILDGAGRVLLVRPIYKTGWDLPGGYIEEGETPSEACAREVEEELGLRRPIGQMLVVDWAPHPDEGDKILFVFDGGSLTEDELARVRLDAAELHEHAFHQPDRLDDAMPERLAKRVRAAVDARRLRRTRYLEHGGTLAESTDRPRA
jgi:8-oxo-dGTP diphosphatase